MVGFSTSKLFHCLLFFVWRQGLNMQPRLAWTSQCTPDWPQTCDSPVSDSCVLGL
jgi:hypothetical protein